MFHPMKKAALLSLVLAATVLAAEPPTEVVITNDSVSTFYRQFKRLTKEPLRPRPAVAALCDSFASVGAPNLQHPHFLPSDSPRQTEPPHLRQPPLEITSPQVRLSDSNAKLTLQPKTVPNQTMAFQRQSSPTNTNPGIHIYANPLANSVIAQKRKVFPAGAVIVKEKLGDDGAVTGIGGMVKRASGFDPRNGDWEWFYSDKASGFTMGKMQNCADCHANSKDKDYVISVWKLAK